MLNQSVKIALAQVSACYLDTTATLEKMADHVAEASRHGADLILFPETWISAFPAWCALSPCVKTHELFRALVRSSLTINSDQIKGIGEMAREHGVWVSVGFNERALASVGGMWNSNLVFDRAGNLVNHRRKLVPTFFEKLVWSNGDGAGLEVIEGDIGNIGMLICGENTNPLARFALMAGGEQLHLSTYPPIWPTHEPEAQTNYDLAQAIRIRSAAVSFEGKCFNAVASGIVDGSMKKALSRVVPEAADLLDQYPQAPSMLVNPRGQVVSETTPGEEVLHYVEAALEECIEPKQFHDLSVGYNRFDVFQFAIDRRRLMPMEIIEPTTQREGAHHVDKS